jgi:hypothetical protein
MRKTWNTRPFLLSILVFLFILSLLPCHLRAAKSVRISPEVTPVYHRWEFGEPGHDPFNKGGNGEGNEERNRDNGNGTQCFIPGDNGNVNDPSILRGNYNDATGMLETRYRDILSWIISLIR